MTEVAEFAKPDLPKMLVIFSLVACFFLLLLSTGLDSDEGKVDDPGLMPFTSGAFKGFEPMIVRTLDVSRCLTNKNKDLIKRI